MNVYPVARFWAAQTAAAAALLISSTALAQGTGVLSGRVVDTSTHQPVQDVVVSVASPALQGEQVVVTDGTGQFRVPNLPPGVYTIRYEAASYHPLTRSGVSLRIDTTIRLNTELLPEALEAEEVTVLPNPPTVDVGSSATGVNVDADFVNRIPLNATSSKGAATRSFESLAEVAPGAQADTYGVSIGGTTSPENRYVVDGVPVNNPAFGVIGTPLSVEFVEQANVITGGYMPEYGRATGGYLDVITKTGSNWFHGSVFASITPGIFEGARRAVQREGSTISTNISLSSLQDAGFDLGGPIVRDKLWFYVGVSPSYGRYRLDRELNTVLFDKDGNAAQRDGYTLVNPIPGTKEAFYATQRAVTFLGKLTFRVNQDNTITLAVSGAPTSSGGNGSFGLNPRNGLVEIQNANNGGIINGTVSALAHNYVSTPIDTSLKWSTAFNNKHLLVDTTLGWHHEEQFVRASDGTSLGSGQGLSNLSQVFWQRDDPHTIDDFESTRATRAACSVGGVSSARVCPVATYYSGGPGALPEAWLDTIVARSMLTALFMGAGHHVVKAGVELEVSRYSSSRGYSGTDIYQETPDGTAFTDFRQFGFLVGPDKAVPLSKFEAVSKSTTIGGFAQDSWSILDEVTLNVGLRYDAQLLYGSDRALAFALPNQFSPRVGVIYDFTRRGGSKIFANYARFYESVPLDAIDRSIPGERQFTSTHDAKICDPRNVGLQQGVCRTDASREVVGPSYEPNQLWNLVGSDRSPVDPDLQAQSADELVVGGEFELFWHGRLGIEYTKRWQNRVIEDMSRDEAVTYFIGNPGYGIASDFPKPVRNYDAVTLYFQKSFEHTWLAQASYTASYLRGNWSGLFRPENGQLDPNINSDFDLSSLLPNRTGPLPGDHTHQVKIFAAKEFEVGDSVVIDIGASYRGLSGGPTSYLGAHPIYGADQAYILPRGSGPRLPWVHNIDAHIGVGVKIASHSKAEITLDNFNIFNFQQAISVDQRYTQDSVLPIPGGTTADLKHLTQADGSPVVKNPNFGKTNAYQAPRSFRFGVKVTF